MNGSNRRHPMLGLKQREQDREWHHGSPTSCLLSLTSASDKGSKALAREVLLLLATLGLTFAGMWNACVEATIPRTVAPVIFIVTKCWS